MPQREFFIYTASDEKCTVKEDGVTTTRQFTDILAALNYVRQQRDGEKVRITCYDLVGRVVFTETV
ncbi:MAG: hypothetical protein P4L99_20040 [Chthoniobacter sp.]|nr:hypothetical protein [Chthoniobacter sp.]